MADSINTGPGGFGVDGQTYTFDTGVPEDQGGSQGPRHGTIDVSDAFVDKNGNPKDLTKKTKTTLSQYLSKVTKGQEGSTPVSNRYVVDQKTSDISTTTKDGNPGLQSPGSGPVSNVDAFAPAPEETNALSNKFPIISPNIKKGKGTATAIDGHDLLPGIPGDSSFVSEPGQLNGTTSQVAHSVKGHPDTTKAIKPYVSAVLSNNRFALAGANNGQKAFTETGEGSDAGFNPNLTVQSHLGQYDPLAPSVTLGRLATIGPLLTMRAGKELNAASAGADPNSAGMQASAILPGVTQLGLSRVDQQVLLASDVLASLTTDELDNANVISVGNLSWGQLNNTDDPYSGTDALGMLALSIALVAGLELLIDALSVLLGLITPSLKKPARDAQGRYSLGEYLPGSKAAKKSAAGGIGGSLSALTSLNFGALLGIQPTNYPFNRALTTGLNAFFGIPDNGGGGIGLNQLAGALTSSTDSPGFNVVVARSIIRSSLTIVDQMKKIGGNVMNAITQVLALIDTIRSSKLVSACNVFASLGDAILSNPKDFVDQDTAQVKTSKMDAKTDSINAVTKNRLKGSLKLAWAANRAPANILLPASVFASSLSVKNLGQFGLDAGLRKDPYSLVKTNIVTPADAGRLPTETVFQIEDELEASYVPFYFHDVRTNEVVSFHAFIASLTDDYTAAYDKAEGFGRVEAVKIYKGTERRITMSFYVIATSMPDFDEMWVKINKLVTLVYPQYTQGLQLQDSTGNFKFTQPFSQLVGASPLVRIRLGDLIRSNYSVFALGRLFGMGNPNFVIDGEKFTAGDAVDQGAIDDYETKIQQLLQNPDGSATFTPDWNRNYEYVDPSSASGGVSIPTPPIPLGGSNKGPKFGPLFSPSDSPYKGCFIIKVMKLDPDNPFQVIGEVASNDDPLYLANTTGIKSYVNQNFNNDDLPLQKFIGGTYKFPISALTPTQQTLSKVAAKASVLQNLTPDSEWGKKAGEFLNPKNNAVAKSFQDTGGKGLAGFIETMNFDWYDKVTWEIDHNRTAPRMCKVSITFSPVHDISPGIDHNGFNRAPVYPVGAMAQGPMPYQKVK